MKRRVLSTETSIRVEDAPDTTGVTSSLRSVTVRPTGVVLWTNLMTGRTLASVSGGAILKYGRVSDAVTVVKVSTNPEDKTYPPAPQWIRDLIEELRGTTVSEMVRVVGGELLGWELTKHGAEKVREYAGEYFPGEPLEMVRTVEFPPEPWA